LKIPVSVEICSVVLQPLPNPHWASSSFGSIILAASWHTLFLGGFAKRCRGRSFIHSCLPFFAYGDDLFTIKLFAIVIKLGFSSGIRELTDAQFYGSFHLCKVKTSRLKNFTQFCQVR